MSRQASTATTIFLACAIAIGIFVRITDITTKAFFSDEAFSVLRITGHTEAQVRRLVDDRVRPISELAALQEPDANTSVGATLASIGTEEPQRGPLYYAAATLWLRVAGTSIAGLRSLAVIIGIATIGSAFLFGAYAFSSRLGGAVLAALVSASPFHFAYARQTREYGLFAFAIFLSATALFYALRERKTSAWFFVALSGALGMLTTPLFGLVFVSYVAYVLVRTLRNAESWRVFAYFVAAAVGALLVAAPWYLYVARTSSKVGSETSWGDTVYPPLLYIEKLVFETGAVFFDFEFAHLWLVAALVVIFAAAGYLVMRGAVARQEAITFAIVLALPTIAVLVGNDLRIGAHFATIGRYATPVWIALEMAVTAGFVACANVSRASRFAVVSIGVIIFSGLFCAFADRPYQEWWDNNDSIPIADIGMAANVHPRGIIVASKYPLALALVHYLDPTLSFQLYSDEKAPPLAASGGPNLLLLPTNEIRASIATQRAVAGMTAVISQRADTIANNFHTRLIKSPTGGRSASDAYITAENSLWVVRMKGR